MLQYPTQEKRGLILGAAHSYASELRVRTARDLYRPRLRFGRYVSAANEHSTPAQRLYNLLCIAYGSDKELFAEVVDEVSAEEARRELRGRIPTGRFRLPHADRAACGP